MPGPVGYLIWILGTILEASVVVCSIRRKAFRRYFFLNLYMLLSSLVSLGRFQVLRHSGLDSIEYAYFYFYSDALLTIALYFALISLYLLVFDEMHLARYLRLGALLLAKRLLLSQHNHKPWPRKYLNRFRLLSRPH